MKLIDLIDENALFEIKERIEAVFPNEIVYIRWDESPLFYDTVEVSVIMGNYNACVLLYPTRMISKNEIVKRLINSLDAQIEARQGKESV